MYSRRDAYAAFLFGGMYLAVCAIPGFIAGLTLGIWALWRGFSDGNLLFLGGGLLAIFFAPILLAIVVVVFCLSGAIATGIAFFLIAPLFRVLESATSKAWLVVAGSLAGLGGGMLGFGLYPIDAVRQYSVWSAPIAFAYGLCASGLYLWLHRAYFKGERKSV